MLNINPFSAGLLAALLVSFTPQTALSDTPPKAVRLAVTAQDLTAIVTSAQSGFHGTSVTRNDNASTKTVIGYVVDKPIGGFADCSILADAQNTKRAMETCLVFQTSEFDAAQSAWGQLETLVRKTLGSGWTYSIPRLTGDMEDALEATQPTTKTTVRIWRDSIVPLGRDPNSPLQEAHLSVTTSAANFQ